MWLPVIFYRTLFQCDSRFCNGFGIYLAVDSCERDILISVNTMRFVPYDIGSSVGSGRKGFPEVGITGVFTDSELEYGIHEELMCICDQFLGHSVVCKLFCRWQFDVMFL